MLPTFKLFARMAMLTFLAMSGVLASQDHLFSLTIAAPDEPLKSGGQLVLRVTVTNTWDRTLAFIRSPGPAPEEGFRYQVEVRNAKGQPPPPSAQARALKNKTTATFESRYAYSLKPGESFVDQIDVTKLYDMTEPGTYTISVVREVPPAQNLGKGRVKSNSVVVTVTR
jgi:hypothetical protein